MKPFIYLGVICLALTSIEAAQTIEMDSSNLFKCTLSSRHHNRIFVEGQRIKKIFYPEGDISIRIKRGVILRSSMRLVGPLYTIYVMTIENNGKRQECIYEREINCIDGEWVFLEKNKMKRNDKMLALIGVKTYEQ